MQLFLWLVALIVFSVSFKKDKTRTLESLKKSLTSLRNLSFGLFCMIFSIGFVLAVVPEESLVSLFTTHGFWGFALVSIVGALLTMPGPIAFPMAGALLNMGASPDLLATFISTLTMVGVATLPLEISYFGRRFSFLRQLFSFIGAIAIGITVGFLI